MSAESNGRLIRRHSPALEAIPAEHPDIVHTKLHLELGWGPRGARFDWETSFGISDGEILAVEPRFRGLEVVSPLEGEGDEATRSTGRL